MNALVRWNTRQPAFPRADVALDDLFAGFFRPIADTARDALEPIRIEVTEDANTYRVAAQVPGVKKEDIHLSVNDNEVTISAEIKREASAKEGEKLLHSERFYGKTTRSFALAESIDEGNVSAKYADGILNLTLPKKAPATAKRIEIA
ncbi:MAG: Hsp20/alpha crystallin family protein [Betaproteobacteria bacterium]|nr:Hsp20/alpha crystallin family protein [Betaproteobacteria bacterium]